MTPRTTKGAIEKLWRVRQYLRDSYRCKQLTLEELIAIEPACDITYKAQVRVWDGE